MSPPIYSNNKNIARSSIWESRVIDLSPPICSVSRSGNSFILSGKTDLQSASLPQQFSSMSPLVELYSSFSFVPRLGQCAGSVGGPYAVHHNNNNNNNFYLGEGKDPLLTEDTLKEEWEMYANKLFSLNIRPRDAVNPDPLCVSESNNITVFLLL